MRLPPVMLWAWERPDDLTSVDPQKAGVAFLARTIYLRPPGTGVGKTAGGDILLRPRLQPLRVAAGTPLMAVVRIDTGEWLRVREFPASDESESLPEAGSEKRQSPHDPSNPLYPHNKDQRDRVSAMIVDAARLPAVRALQIDFDATSGERAFYRALLEEVRRQLPARMPLSITALASWCIGDPWLDDLPAGTIDEAVPMLFRMGPDAGHVAGFLLSGRDFRAAACRRSAGVSNDEPLSLALVKELRHDSAERWSSRRVYIFGGGNWTKEAAASALLETAQ